MPEPAEVTGPVEVSSGLRGRVTRDGRVPEIVPAPSATSPAIRAVLPLAEWYSTSTFPMRFSTFNAATDAGEL